MSDEKARELHFKVYKEPHGFNLVYMMEESTALHNPDYGYLRIFIEKEAYARLDAENKRLRDALEKIVGGLAWQYQRVIAREALNKIEGT